MPLIIEPITAVSLALDSKARAVFEHLIPPAEPPEAFHETGVIQVLSYNLIVFFLCIAFIPILFQFHSYSVTGLPTSSHPSCVAIYAYIIICIYMYRYIYICTDYTFLNVYIFMYIFVQMYICVCVWSFLFVPLQTFDNHSTSFNVICVSITT